MDKTIHTPEYGALLRLLRRGREDAALTQAEVAARVGQTQSFVSKVERGERRLDVLELRVFCAAIGLTLPAFVERLEVELARPAGGREPPGRRPSGGGTGD